MKTLSVILEDDEDGNEIPTILGEGFVFEPTWVLAFSNDGQVASMMTKPGWPYSEALAALTSIQEILMRRAGYFDRDFPGFQRDDDEDGQDG